MLECVHAHIRNEKNSNIAQFYYKAHSLCYGFRRFRLGAWDYLQWKNVSPIINDKGEIISAKLLIYADEPEEYYTFITSEAYRAIKDWMDFRSSYGEIITIRKE